MPPERIPTTTVVDTKIKYILAAMAVAALVIMGGIAYVAVSI